MVIDYFACHARHAAAASAFAALAPPAAVAAEVFFRLRLPFAASADAAAAASSMPSMSARHCRSRAIRAAAATRLLFQARYRCRQPRRMIRALV